MLLTCRYSRRWLLYAETCGIELRRRRRERARAVLLKSSCMSARRCFNTECKCRLLTAALETPSHVVFNFSTSLHTVQRWPWISSEASVFPQLCRLPWKLGGEMQRCSQMWQKRIYSVFPVTPLIILLFVDRWLKQIKMLTHQATCVCVSVCVSVCVCVCLCLCVRVRVCVCSVALFFQQDAHTHTHQLTFGRTNKWVSSLF